MDSKLQEKTSYQPAVEALRCGNYAEHWEYLGKPKGWKGCSKPKGHEGACGDDTKLSSSTRSPAPTGGEAD